MKNIRCEHPVVIFHPHLVWLYCTRAIAVRLGDRLVEVKRSPRDFYNFPWYLFVPYKDKVTPDTIDDYFLYDAQDNAYPVFMLVPCGKCRLCRENRVNEWITRCICESSASDYPPLFITLTYDRQHYPKDGVSVDDVQRFLKRLRRRVEYNLGKKVHLRYFLVSEYGKKTKRGHYHLLLWNMPYVSMYEGQDNSFYALWQFIRDAWQQGFVRVERCRDNSGRYCFKYMRKECVVPQGKNPTFHLASRRPGLGFYWLDQHFKEYYEDQSAQNLSIRSVDKNGAPTVITRPIPSYFKRKLWPTVCQLFPQPVSNAVRDFMKSAAEAFYSQNSLYPDSDRPAQILSMVDYVRNKYGDIFPIDFDAACPKFAFCRNVNSYVLLRDAENSCIPAVDFRRSYSYVADKYYYDDNGNLDALITTVRQSLTPSDDIVQGYIPYKTVTGQLLTSTAYSYRKSFIQSWSLMKSSFKVLFDYQFDKNSVLDILGNTARHAATVSLLNEDKPPIDIDAEVHQYEVDRRWENTHWLEDQV